MKLACDTLTLMRDGERVVERVTARLEAGHITAIVGPNGAGKSTLLMGLAGLLEPSHGKVELGTRNLAAILPAERAQHIGYLEQNAEIAWDVSVENLIALGRHPHGDAASAPVEEAIRVLELEKLRHQPATRLSGGERARVLLGRVLAGEPRWVLADEPLAALDLAHQLKMIEHFKRFAKGAVKGAAPERGVVIVLHDLALAMNHADRVLVMRGGKLIAHGTPRTALDTDTITRGWGVKTRWIGVPGQRALATLGTE